MAGTTLMTGKTPMPGTTPGTTLVPGTALLPPPGLVVADDLPDVLAPRKPMTGIIGFVRRRPTLAFGASILIVMVFAAMFAPWVGCDSPAYD